MNNMKQTRLLYVHEFALGSLLIIQYVT